MDALVELVEEELDPGERALWELECSVAGLRQTLEDRTILLGRLQDENRILRGALRRMGVDTNTLLQRPQAAQLDVPF